MLPDFNFLADVIPTGIGVPSAPGIRILKPRYGLVLSKGVKMGYMVPLIAAAAKRREQEQEKEELAMIERLAQDDGEGRYEYKILRSYSNAFRNPERRRQILNEEARAGWEMVATLDNARLIVRRPHSTGAIQTQGIDP